MSGVAGGLGAWSVDPNRVEAVFAAVDRVGEPLAGTVRVASAIANRGGSLDANGSSRLSTAWAEFMEFRALIPGKAISVIADACGVVSQGTLILLDGDEEMTQLWKDETRALNDPMKVGP